jgi:hypothetical protein
LPQRGSSGVLRQLATVPEGYKEPIETPTVPDSADVVIIGKVQSCYFLTNMLDKKIQKHEKDKENKIMFWL